MNAFNILKIGTRVAPSCLGALLLTGLLGGVAGAQGLLKTITDTSYVVGNSFIDPAAVISGDMVIGQQDFIAPFTVVSAGTGYRVEMNSESNFQDNETMMAAGDNLIAREQMSIAHGATIIDSTQGSFVFVGFNAHVQNAVLEDGVMVLYGARVEGVTMPEDSVLPPGSVITTASQTTGLPAVTEAKIEFKNEVLDVNTGFAVGYGEMAGELGRIDTNINKPVDNFVRGA